MSCREQYGYKAEQELLDICYAFPEFKRATEGDILLASDLGERISVDLSEDDCDSLDLALTPEFVVSMANISEGLERSTIDWDRVKTVEYPISPGA